MHILEIPSFFPPYGGQFCLDQAKALKSLGHEVRILSNVQLGATIGLRDYVVRPYLRFEHQMEGVTVCQSYQRGLPKMIGFNVRRWVHIVRSMFRDYVRQYGCPDVIHAHCAKWAGYAAMLIGKEHGVPYVITEHLSAPLYEAEFGPAPSKAWQITFLREAYQHAAMVVPVAEELVASMAPYFGKDYRWTPISNLIDTDYFCYRPRTLVEGQPFHFCCIANFLPLKGYDVLFQAFRILSADKDAILSVAGPGTDSEACRKMAKEAGIETKVRFLGRLSKTAVRDLLYHAGALVLASRSEVQPLVLLEAMSTGLPVVATEVTPASLRIEGGCHIVPTDDADALAKAMAQVMTGTVDGALLSEKIKALASPDVVARQLERVFQAAIDRA